MTTPKVKRILAQHRGEVLKLDIGCGENKMEDHIGMDYKPFAGVDLVHDARETPWPWPDETFTLLSSSHFLEHIPREDGVFIDVMNECWRILKKGGQFRIAVPYGGSTMYFADPTHINPIVPQTFHYFDPLAPLQTYHVYKPKPWKIDQMYWAPDGTIECLLSKRRPDPSYGKR
jgi:SAM-dependent methyltransferase